MPTLVLHPALIAAVVVLCVAAVAFVALATRRGWFHWDAIDTASPARSAAGLPRLLAVVRAVVLGYALWVVVYTLDAPNAASQLVFYTVWNFLSLTAYFALALSVSVWVLAIGRHASPLAARGLWLLFETNAAMVLLVDVVVWTVLYPQMRRDGTEREVLNLSSYHMHGANAAFMAAEFALNDLPLVPAHAIVPVTWGLAYGAFTWGYYTHSGTWPYFFLDTTEGVAAAWYIGVCALHVAFFLFVWACYRGKTAAIARCVQTQSHAPTAEQHRLLGEGGALSDDWP